MCASSDKRCVRKINLCSGPVPLDGYINIDISRNADIILDMEKDLLPFPDESVNIVVCISAINYFSRQRSLEIIKDVYRVLKPDGVARFASQDLRILAEKYLNNDLEFYFQKLPDDRDRFPGETIADKFNGFFYGFHCGDKHCKCVYDFESLKTLFEQGGFSVIEQKRYCESIIPDVDKIDNRPEQMFFLEAIKNGTSPVVSGYETDKSSAHQKYNYNDVQPTDTDAMRNLAFSMWEADDKDKAWQYLLKVLELKPDDSMAVAKCADILNSLSRFEDLLKLYTDYLNLKPDDLEIKNRLEETQNRLKQNQQNRNNIILQRRCQLDKLDQRFNTILPNDIHLSGCMQWLTRAQEVNDGGGIAASYHMDSQHWAVDYPETTGYIVPTFLCYYRLTGVESYRKRAIDMGDWEIAIQSPEGGIGEPVGVYGLRPRVFNTGQVILGWLALYTETGQSKYLTAAEKAANWIIEKQDHDGKWTANTYAGPKSYHIRVAWALLELFKHTNRAKYKIAAERNTKWTLDCAHSNGWFANTSLSVEGKPWTHLIGYTLFGLLEICRFNNAQIDRRKIMYLLYNAAKALASFYIKLKENADTFLTLPETFDSNWSSTDSRSCITGNAQIELFLSRMFKYTEEPVFQSAAELLLNDLKQIHLLDGITDSNIFGGLPGSYPVGAGYLSYAIPNWGVKFFADSLLQKLLPEHTQNYLG